ncbi:MAG: DUF3021 family protein [Clostridia bacterium]|nr:DUF3021 family protein [Clostridia bacterium]
MNKKILDIIEKYLTRKIGVEIKCCLMFFMVLCFYSGYRLICGSMEAGIIHMLEMVVLAYLLGWIQALIGSDFDEVDRLCAKDWAVVLIGSLIYTAASLLFGWLDGNPTATVLFAVYMVITYLCIFLIHKIKRAIDAKLLNNDLMQFQKRNKEI